MKRILAAWLPNWPVQRLICKNPELKQKPIILHHSTRRGLCVLACSRAAQELGVQAGMPVAEANALLQRGATPFHQEAHDPVVDREALEKLAVWSQRFSPLVGLEETDPPETLLLDIAGVVPLFGDESSLAEQVTRGFGRIGLTVQLGAAKTVGAAWAIAHYGSADELTQLPVTALRLPPEMAVTLGRLGLERIEDLSPLPRAELKLRLGPLLLKRWDQFFGTAPEMIRPIRAPAEFLAQWLFEYPVARQSTIEQVIRQLLERLCFMLRQQDRGVLGLTCKLDCQETQQAQEVKSTATFEVGLFQPSADADHLQSLADMQLEQLHLSASVTAITVSVTNSAPHAWRQQELFDQQQRRHDSPQVAALIDRLAGRLGRHAILRCSLHNDAQPEMAYRTKPLVDAANKRKKNPPLAQSFAPLDRPLHLLGKPEPLQVYVVAPSEQPRCFHYQNRKHDVARCWGPERIETGWWRRRGVRRDYYRVETEAGSRFWLYRRIQDGQWFLHGIFD